MQIDRQWGQHPSPKPAIDNSTFFDIVIQTIILHVQFNAGMYSIYNLILQKLQLESYNHGYALIYDNIA